MSSNDAQTNDVQTVRGQMLPRYQDLNSEFESAIQKPERRPMGFHEKLVHASKRFYDRITDHLWGIDTPDEYDTGKSFVPSVTGVKYHFDHIKNGIRESHTTVLNHRRPSGRDKLEHEIQTITYPDSKEPQKRVTRSTHNLIINNGYEEDQETRTQVITEGTTLPDGESLSRTQNFETGETTFRKHKGGLFQTWTFNANHQLTEQYEGRFGEPGRPDIISQYNYGYTPNGALSSAVETRTTITSDGEKTQTINHPVSTEIGLKSRDRDGSR